VNFEPLLRIARIRVPKAALSKDTIEYVSVPINWAPKPLPETVRIGYARGAKVTLGILAIGISSMFFYVFFLDPSITGRTLWTQLAATFFILLPMPILAEVSLSYFVLNDEGIERRVFHVKKVFIPWSEVEAVNFTYGRYGNSFNVVGHKKKMELMTWLDGMPQFARMVAAKVPPEKWARSRTAVMALIEES